MGCSMLSIMVVTREVVILPADCNSLSYIENVGCSEFFRFNFICFKQRICISSFITVEVFSFNSRYMLVNTIVFFHTNAMQQKFVSYGSMSM